MVECRSSVNEDQDVRDGHANWVEDSEVQLIALVNNKTGILTKNIRVTVSQLGYVAGGHVYPLLNFDRSPTSIVPTGIVRQDPHILCSD